MSKPNKSGSFVLRASQYQGANPNIPVPNPEFLVDGKYVTEYLNLRGTYRFKFKTFYINWSSVYSTASAVSPAGEAILAPTLWFVSPQVSSYATRTNYLSFQWPGTVSFNSTQGLGNSLETELIATVDGYIQWNFFVSNPWYGNTTPYPTISPWATYAAGMTPDSTTQPFWVSKPHFITGVVNVDWECID